MQAPVDGEVCQACLIRLANDIIVDVFRDFHLDAIFIVDGFSFSVDLGRET
jgi:hypothetical protein